MRNTTASFHLTTALTVVSLVAGSLAPLARAQPAAPASPAQTDAPPVADPPARVGRLARAVGVVSSHALDQSTWTQAALNVPVTSGDAFWTEPQAEADVEVGATLIALAAQTELSIDTLDDSTLAATEAQGEIYLRLRDVPAGSIVRVATPRGVVAITIAGRYAITAGDTDHATSVTVVEGAAHVGGGALSLNIGPHQTASLTGSADFQGSVEPEQDDAFLRAQLDRQRQAVPAHLTAYLAPPPVVAQMTGADALADTGEWDSTPQYGAVWYPPVARDWVPYRDGHWAWIAPWGWTWVDNAAWGFAPSHYGRWVEVHDRWGWEPVTVGVPVQEAPCYAPALVSWVDVAGGAALGAAAVGWIPLGPREPYRPPYRTSERYIRRVNAPNVTNITNITTFNNRPVENFVNRRAATVVPAEAMVASQSIATRVQPEQMRAFAAARAIAQPPVRPTFATAGVTPAAARALNLAPSGSTPQATRPPAPGPAVQPRRLGPVPLRAAAVPATSAAPTSAPAAEPARPGASAGVGAAAAGTGAVLGGAALLARPSGQVAPQPPPLPRPGQIGRPRTPAPPPQAAIGAARPALNAPAPPAPGSAGPAARNALPPLATPRGPGPSAALRPSGPPPPSVPNAGAPPAMPPRPMASVPPGLPARANAPASAGPREPVPALPARAIPRPPINDQLDRARVFQPAARPVPQPPALQPRQFAQPAPQRAPPPATFAPQFRPAPPPRAAPQAPPPAPVMRAPPVMRPAPPQAVAPPRPAPPAPARPAPQRDPRHP